MNTRSLSFRLVAWYAGLLTLVFLLLGAVMFAVVANDLQSSMRNDQMRRAQQISDTLLKGISHSDEPTLAKSVETLYAPEANGRFIRITRGDGTVLFESGEPRDGRFAPDIAPLRQLPASPSWREVRLPDGASLVVGTVIHRSRQWHTLCRRGWRPDRADRRGARAATRRACDRTADRYCDRCGRGIPAGAPLPHAHGADRAQGGGNHPAQLERAAAGRAHGG